MWIIHHYAAYSFGRNLWTVPGFHPGHCIDPYRISPPSSPAIYSNILTTPHTQLFACNIHQSLLHHPAPSPWVPRIQCGSIASVLSSSHQPLVLYCWLRILVGWIGLTLFAHTERCLCFPLLDQSGIIPYRSRFVWQGSFSEMCLECLDAAYFLGVWDQRRYLTDVSLEWGFFIPPQGIVQIYTLPWWSFGLVLAFDLTQLGVSQASALRTPLSSQERHHVFLPCMLVQKLAQ